jgi:enoyl-CoA hydratase
MRDSPTLEKISGEIAIIRFTKPAERNPLSHETLDRLAAFLERLKQEPTIRAVILTGTDDVFLSGADIRDLRNLDRTSATIFSQKGQSLAHALAELQPVTIAAINGYCMGGGLDLALACNTRIASQSAVFAHPGARLGIITGWGGTQRLPRLIGRTRAIELFVTARRLSSTDALEAGLVTQIADPVLETAIAVAKQTITTS